MKKKIISALLNKIKKKEVSKEKLEIISYGLESLYILITKTIIILSISYILNIFYEILIFTLFYNFIRIPSFGVHAKNSTICLLFSLISFLSLTFVSKNIIIPFNIKIFLLILNIIFIIKNAPADTLKRPIVNKKRRLTLKIISSLIALLMMTFSLISNDSFISNSLLLAVLFQNIMLSKITYKIFDTPYDNYRKEVIK